MGWKNWRTDCQKIRRATFCLKRILQYWNTIRYLRLAQIFARLINYIYKPYINICKAPSLGQMKGRWCQPLQHHQTLIKPKTFLFLNEIGCLGEVGWKGPERGKLWRYNQHYFDDLNAFNNIERREWHHALLDDWLNENPPFEGEGWEPYPCSLRVVNLIKWMASGHALSEKHIESLGNQVRWISKKIETHLLGNHILANSKALIFAGLFFRGREAESWLRTGENILSRELIEQILPDGAHFEISPMYHRIILEDILDILNLSSAYPNRLSPNLVQQMKSCSPQMLRWMEIMSHSDGEVSFFNDTAMKVTSEICALKNYAARVGVSYCSSNISSQEYLKESGFFRWSNCEAVLIGDVGSIGPDYIPGHGHADTLSFEFSYAGQRIIVNSGTSLYEESSERLRQRGTSAHSTVEINGENSSEVWKSFRVARRANPFDFRIKKHGGEWIEIVCSHDGYKRLKGRNIHCRSWQLKEGRLVIRDEIQGPFVSAVARFHLHPAIKVTGNSLLLPNGMDIQFRGEGGEFQIVKSTWHPEFGKSIPSHCIEFHLNTSKASVFFEWN